MSLHVDVWAVIDEAILRAGEDARQYRFEQDFDGANLRDVRAAVAHLVGAAGEMLALAKGPVGGVAQQKKRDSIANLERALAKFGVQP